MIPDPKIVKRVLALLREKGWKSGVKEVEAEVEKAQDPDERAMLQFLLG